MPTDEEVAAKKAAEEAEKKRKEDADAAVAAAAKASEEASKKEKQFWTDFAASISARVRGLEDNRPSHSWPVLAALALVLGGFSAIVILLVFVASVQKRMMTAKAA